MAGAGGNCGELNVVLAFDRSGSMATNTPLNQERYAAATASFNQWASSSDAQGTRVALMLHPMDDTAPGSCNGDPACNGLGPCINSKCLGTGSTSCTSSTYAAPFVIPTALPAGAATFAAVLAGAEVNGASPHSAAVAGAIARAKTIATNRPNDTTIVVFFADAAATSCSTSWTDIATEAANGPSGNPSVPVHVIGMDSLDTAGFNQVAASGGTTDAIMTAEGDLKSALNQIKAQYPCP